MSAENVAMVRRGYEAVLRGDIDAIASILDPDVKWHGGDPNAEGACHNRTEAVGFMRAALRRQPLGELVDVIDAGDQVVVVMRPLSREDGPGALAANLTTIRDGRVIEMVHYPDPADALAAAGVEPRTF